MLPRVMVIEDDDTLRRVMHAQLAEDGYQTEPAPDVPAALEILERSPQNVVIGDLNLPGISGVDLLRRVHSDSPSPPVIVMTAFRTIQSAVEAMKPGAYDYVVKPIYAYELKTLVTRALGQHKSLQIQPRQDEKHGFNGIVGSSRSMLE